MSASDDPAGAAGGASSPAISEAMFAPSRARWFRSGGARLWVSREDISDTGWAKAAWGVLFATFITLLLVPCLYLMVEDWLDFIASFKAWLFNDPTLKRAID